MEIVLNMCGIVGFTGRHQAAPILWMDFPNWNIEDMIQQELQFVMERMKQKYIKAKGRLKVLMEKTIAENLYQEHVVLDIPGGQLMENHLRTMHIRMSVMTEMWLLFIMVSLRIIRN